MNNNIRVRFAPSPTGPLHIGGVRTALYNFLFARKNGGKVILRIEDTDQNRYVEGAEDYIIRSFQWCGIDFDEDVLKGGPFGPYRQSERRGIYHDYALQLVNEGKAYYAFDTPEELIEMREKLENSGANQVQYGPHTRSMMKNSLTLPADDTEYRLKGGEHFVIRIKMPEDSTIVVNDIIRGEVVVNTSNLDDKVLFKSDGWPTYHLANIVDDHLMEITHVIRGEEWLPSAPLHVYLYQCFGWEKTMPRFAHLPLLLKPDGNGKLSKRDGDRLGFPVFPLQWQDPVTGEISSGYRESGYLPEPFVNMLALLGWNPGTEKELFTMQELISEFSLERVGKHGSKFDPEKARWFNHQHILNLSHDQLASLMIPVLEKKGIITNIDYLTSVSALVHDRITLLSDVWPQSWFFFEAPETYDEAVIRKVWNPAGKIRALVTAFSGEASALSEWDHDSLHSFIQDFITRHDSKMGQLMNPLRLLVVGSNQGPGMMDIAVVLGKEEFLRRIDTGLTRIDYE